MTADEAQKTRVSLTGQLKWSPTRLNNFSGTWYATEDLWNIDEEYSDSKLCWKMTPGICFAAAGVLTGKIWKITVLHLATVQARACTSGCCAHGKLVLLVLPSFHTALDRVSRLQHASAEFRQLKLQHELVPASLNTPLLKEQLVQQRICSALICLIKSAEAPRHDVLTGQAVPGEVLENSLHLFWATHYKFGL